MHAIGGAQDDLPIPETIDLPGAELHTGRRAEMLDTFLADTDIIEPNVADFIFPMRGSGKSRESRLVHHPLVVSSELSVLLCRHVIFLEL